MNKLWLFLIRLELIKINCFTAHQRDRIVVVVFGKV